MALALSAIAAAAQPQPEAVTAEPCCTIPAGTPAVIEITEPVSSRDRSGRPFALRLAEPIKIGGRTIVAAGTTGTGEVVHAQPALRTGRAGELILAARYLQYRDIRIPLRRLGFARSGSDGHYLFLPGLTVQMTFQRAGGDVDVPAGAIFQVQVAAPVLVPAD